MLFPKRQQVLTQYTGTATQGAQVNFSLTRDFFLDSLLLVQPVTVAGVTGTKATYTSYGLWNLIKRVQLQIADGSSNRNQTDASGAALIRRAGKVLNGLDRNTIYASGTSTQILEDTTIGGSNKTYYITVPLLFKNPQISDPIGSATLLPLPRYNTNPNLVITYGADTDVFSAAHGGACTLGAPYLVINKRQVDKVTFPTLETEFIENNYPQSATGTNILAELQVPGSYTGIDILTTNASGVATDISGGYWSLQFLGNVLRQFNLQDVKTAEQYSQGNDAYIGSALQDIMPAYYHLDFLHDGFGLEVGELGSVLNTNLLAGSGARLQILMNLASTGNVSFAWERIFGDLSPYTFNFNTQAG